MWTYHPIYIKMNELFPTRRTWTSIIVQLPSQNKVASFLTFHEVKNNDTRCHWLANQSRVLHIKPSG